MKQAVDVCPSASPETGLRDLKKRSAEVEDVNGVEVLDVEVLVHFCTDGGRQHRQQ